MDSKYGFPNSHFPFWKFRTSPTFLYSLFKIPLLFIWTPKLFAGISLLFRYATVCVNLFISTVSLCLSGWVSERFNRRLSVKTLPFVKINIVEIPIFRKKKRKSFYFIKPSVLTCRPSSILYSSGRGGFLRFFSSRFM